MKSASQTLRDNLGALDFDAMREQIGEQIGVSKWIRVDQKMISDFGRATLDPDPMHVDPGWAKENSPFGGTILFGFQTMSFLTCLFHDVLAQGSAEYGKRGVGLNYGFNRVRLMTPIPVDSEIRGLFTLRDVKRRDATSAIQTYEVTVEIGGRDRPALVGDWLVLWASKSENTLAK